MSYSPSEAWQNCSKLASKHIAKMLAQHEAGKACLRAEAPKRQPAVIPKENKKGYVIELKNQGLAVKEIAVLTKCSEAYVRKILSVVGMTCENYVKISPELKEKALHMLRNGSNDYDVSIILKIKLESVRTWRRNILGITFQRGAAGHINNNKQR